MENNKTMSRLTALVTLIVLGIFIMEWQSFSPLQAIAGQSTHIAEQKNDRAPVTKRIRTARVEEPVQSPIPESEIAGTPSTSPAKTLNNSPTPAAAPKANPKPAANKPAPKAKPAAAPAAPAANCSGAFVQEFLCLLNEYRVFKNLNKVSGNSSLSAVALGHSKWMDANNTFSHTGIDGSRLLDRCKAAGTICRAENLAQGVSSAKEVLNMWKNSPSHNVNLLGKYSIIGIGVYGSYTTLLLN